MARLKASERALLPDSAFAYVDSRGRRRLPIHDEAHVRNALARFKRIAFEDEAAQERARTRLLNAAKKYGIVPVGFITGQIREVRGRSGDATSLPTGFVTFLLTDIEDSTGLLRQLSDGYAKVLSQVRRIVREAVQDRQGHEVDARADEFFAVFEGAALAVEAAVSIQRSMADRRWPDEARCRVRIGLHSGEPTLTDAGYIGLSVHTAARVCSSANGGQIVVSRATMQTVGDSLPLDVRLRSLGRHRLPGLAHDEELFQVEAAGLPGDFPPLRTEAASPLEA